MNDEKRAAVVDLEGADLGQPQTTESEQPTTIPSPMAIMWKEIYADKLALFSLIFFVSMMVVVFIWASQLDPREALRLNLPTRNSPPTWELNHSFLGSDVAGRNIVPLMIIGARNSFLLSLMVALSSSVIGIIVGLVAGFYGGQVDNVIMRFIDFMTIIPTLMVIIVIVTILDHSVLNFGMAMVIFGWIGMARSMRMMTLRQGVMDYVSASKTLGTRNLVIIFREVIPNIMSFMIVITSSSKA